MFIGQLLASSVTSLQDYDRQTSVVVVIVLAAIIVFGITIGTPLIKLTSKLTILEASLSNIEKLLENLTSDNAEDHKKFQKEIDRLKDLVSQHDTILLLRDMKGEIKSE